MTSPANKKPRTEPREESSLLTEKEAAAILRINPRTLSTMRSEGRGPAFSKARGIGIRYHRDDIMAYVEKSKTRNLSLPKPA